MGSARRLLESGNFSISTFQVAINVRPMGEIIGDGAIDLF
jgi:hypothetical protein